MASLSELTTDLRDRLLAIPELAANNSVSLGLVDDPKSTNYQNIPLPFAGVRMLFEENLNDNTFVKSKQPIRVTFAVTLHVENGSDDIVLDTSYPFLDKVRATIESVNDFRTAYAWQYESSKIAHIDKSRLLYVQYYSVITVK